MLVFFGFNSYSAQAKDPDEVTLYELQQILLDYFNNNNIDLEVDSDEYIEYLLLQQLENSDETLSKYPQYELLDYYIGEYLYQLEQNQGENSQISNNILAMTIGELKEEIELRNVAEEKFEQELEDLELNEP
ncbi:hypothetical protein MM221_19900 [Salipaludibacillus sp. LMS25]|jgi:hypothetical protein|uniref:hypothetical protein n=1 Tax=Salipaludibacillus sp. LMS25 TaxID=2924031 RepID=UPI0020D15C9E|nr:hypothetical protein [Salipaludibacillus sp. LMS25]UTR14781.1 hypothetical protein MM221_19900 [Salipaludibacillus sp. LMS25]